MADEARFKSFNCQTIKNFKAGGTPPLRINGTAGTVAVTNNFGILPTKSWQQGIFEGREKINGTVLTEKYRVKAKSCFAFPIGCGRGMVIKEDPDKGAGATLACAMERYQRGYLPEEEIAQPLLRGDDRQALVALTEKTAYRQGFGETLTQGNYRLATQWGHPELAIVSRQQVFAAYEPRGEQGMKIPCMNLKLKDTDQKSDFTPTRYSFIKRVRICPASSTSPLENAS